MTDRIISKEQIKFEQQVQHIIDDVDTDDLLGTFYLLMMYFVILLKMEHTDGLELAFYSVMFDRLKQKKTQDECVKTIMSSSKDKGYEETVNKDNPRFFVNLVKESDYFSFISGGKVCQLFKDGIDELYAYVIETRGNALTV